MLWFTIWTLKQKMNSVFISQNLCGILLIETTRLWIDVPMFCD